MKFFMSALSEIILCDSSYPSENPLNATKLSATSFDIVAPTYIARS